MKTMRQKEYAEYLKSAEWRKKRDEVLKKQNHKCIACGCEGNLHVHHHTYENLGNEKPHDLFVLCKGCHLKVHKGRMKIVIFTEEEYEMFSKIEDKIISDKIDYIIIVAK